MCVCVCVCVMAGWAHHQHAQVRTYLVDMPNVISGGNSIDFPDLARAKSAGLRLMSCVALKCACSLAVVKPASTAALLREMKSRSSTFSFCMLPEGMAYQLPRAGRVHQRWYT